MPTRIFILGLHRTGTTWLANQINEHSAVAPVQHPKHFGIHESDYFTYIYGHYGDLRHRTNYIGFVETMTVLFWLESQENRCFIR
jgi:hypothetical protein